MAKYRIENWGEVTPPNKAKLTMQLELEGYSVYAWVDEPGTIYGLHNHSSAQSHWIIRGAMQFNVEGESYILEAGDRDFLPANIYHSSEVSGEETVVYLIGIKN